MKLSNLSDAEFKTLVIRMLKELSEDLNSIKKIQSEMKHILIEIKNLQGKKIVGWMNLRIKSMIWNIRKQKTPNQNKKKKESRKIRIVSAASGTTSSVPTFICITGVPEGEKKEQEIGNLFEKIMKENFPNLVKKIDV